jgi:hypothetical protein
VTFKPGQSGNPKGPPKRAKLFTQALLISLKKTDENDVEAIQRIADKLVAQGLTGDTQAIKEIADRVDGKVPQAIVGDDEHDPVRLVQRIERVIVHPANPDGGGVHPATGTREV